MDKRIQPLSHLELVKLAKAFHTKKHLGQNFLVSPEELAAVADALHVEAGESVLEIGPGLGFLTRHLLAKDANVIAVELDRQCLSQLEQLNTDKLKVVHADFLQFDLNQASNNGKLKVAGNVPYQITAPIIAHLFGEIDKPAAWLGDLTRIVLTVQKEVAERFVSSPGGKDYSQITLLVNYFADASLIKVVPANSFFPEPQVTSAIVAMDVLPEPRVKVKNAKLLRQLIKAGFSQRRKMLKNTLGFLQMPQEQLDNVFRSIAFDPQVRAERLSLKQFALLADAIEPLTGK